MILVWGCLGVGLDRLIGRMKEVAIQDLDVAISDQTNLYSPRSL